MYGIRLSHIFGIPYLLEKAPVLEKVLPSNERSPFDVKYLMSAFLE